jgi:hypothetical protein
MTFRNFPDKPLTPSQQELFDNAVADFKTSKRAEFLQKSVVAAVGFLVLVICGALLLSDALGGGEKLTFWRYLKLLVAGGLVALPPWLLLTAHTLDGGYSKDEKTGVEAMGIRYLCSVDIWKDNRKLHLAGIKADVAAKMATQSGCFDVVLKAVLAIMLGIVFISPLWVMVSFVIGAGSVWFLLGWYVWFNPLEDMRKHYKVESEQEYRRGTHPVIDMPAASCSSPMQEGAPEIEMVKGFRSAPPLPIDSGAYLDGLITLHENGAYSIKNGPRFDQEGVCDGLEIMGVRITKKEPGEGREILFEADGKALRVHFTQGQWQQVMG